MISHIALLCDSVGWTADVERISGWLNGLDRETYELVFAAIEVLEEEGPALAVLWWTPCVGRATRT